MTVAELETVLTADHAAGRKDADEVTRLASYAPSERIGDAELAKLQALSPGPLTSELLRLLAEASLFSPPPAADLPATPAPSFAAQKEMLARTVDYVKTAIPKLPDFLATRSTREYNDNAYSLKKGDWAVKAGLHLVRTEAHQIGFRDGHDSDDPASALLEAGPEAAKKVSANANAGNDNTWDAFRQLQAKGKGRQPRNGLSSWGEFGSILQSVLVDAALSNRIKWARWENRPVDSAEPGSSVRRPSKQVAVFSYETVEQKSHYPINYCCVVAGDGSHGLVAFRRIVPYKGEITIDPEKGSILRVTMDAEMGASDPVMRAAILVDYAPVAIEDADFLCPKRSLALSLAQPDAVRSVKRPMRLSLNEVRFSNYHKFTATARMITDEEASAESGTPAAGADTATAEAAASPAGAAPVIGSASEAAPGQAEAASEPAAGSGAPGAAADTAMVSALPEMRAVPAPAFPQFHVAEDPGTLKAMTRLVDVGIGIYDKHGHALRDIKPEDLQILDNGRPQKVAFFVVPEPPASVAPGAAVAAPADQTGHFSNRGDVAREPGSTGATAGVASVANTTVLLIDQENLSFADFTAAKVQMLEFLKKLAAGERVALYTMDQFGFHVLTEVTTDHAGLTARLQKYQPSIQAIAHAQEAEARNRQSIDWVRTPNDLAFVNGNQDVMGGDTLPDPQLRNFGGQPGREAFRVLIAVARHLAAVPGRKALIWVTSDNALADWQDQSVGSEKNNAVDLRSYVLLAANLMNDAHVSVYPLDASQLEGGGIDASLENRNVEVRPGAVPPNMTMPRNMTAGRSTAQMHADLHAIAGEYRDLAQDTGGRALRRASDMVGNLKGIYEDGHAIYQVSFTPDTTPDNKYHKISVELPGRKGVVIHSRTGYLYSTEDADPRSHFEAVAWQPEDSPEISLTADAGPSPADGPGICRLRVKIRLRDLVLNPKDGRDTDKVDVYLLQRDEYNGQAHSSGETLDLALKPETREKMQTSGFSYERAFRLDGKTGSVRLIVVDENSGKIGSLTISRDALVP
jgi:VWFA-related protein